MHEDNGGLPIVGILGAVFLLAVTGFLAAIFLWNTAPAPAPGGPVAAPAPTVTTSRIVDSSEDSEAVTEPEMPDQVPADNP